MAARPPPPLPDELVEAILLRIPPDDPAGLIRAAATCKHWRRLISGAAFRRGFGRAHRTPPMLGVLRNGMYRWALTVSFFPAYSFLAHRIEDRGVRAIDSRHGRVLLQISLPSMGLGSAYTLAVWNPVTGEQQTLPVLHRFETRISNFNAAVLCASGGGGCDHIDCCRHGPFLVVVVATEGDRVFSYIYSSEANAWTESASSPFLGKLCMSTRGALVEKENSLYFVLQTTPRILGYDLGTREVTVIDSPPVTKYDRIELMTAEGGGLGCVTVKGRYPKNPNSQLCLWSREVFPDRDIRWTLSKAIKLSTLMPTGLSIFTLDVAGFVDGGGVILVGADQRAFVTNLKSGSCKQLSWEGGSLNIIPYMNFYAPALGMAPIDEDPRGSEPVTNPFQFSVK